MEKEEFQRKKRSHNTVGQIRASVNNNQFKQTKQSIESKEKHIYSPRAKRGTLHIFGSVEFFHGFILIRVRRVHFSRF